MNLVVNARTRCRTAGASCMRTYDAPALHGAGAPAGWRSRSPTPAAASIPPIRDRIFEPYFTTRPRGRSAAPGLGLPRCTGSSRRHGGQHRGRVHRAPRDHHARDAARRRRRASGDGSVAAAARRACWQGHGPGRRRRAGRAQGRGLGASRARLPVHTAPDGARGRAIFSLYHAAIDAVMLDLVMPRMDGRATYLALKAIDPDVVVVLTTGHALNEEAQRLLDLGVRRFLPKPFDLPTLGAALADVMRSGHAARGAE